MKKILSVAVNKYNVAPLRGCINDSNSMVEFFKGFEAKQLLDEQATKANIVKELKVHIESLSDGDHFVFHYSGHGSQIPCVDGTEDDGLTEILCPFDLINVDGTWTSNYITDDELASILSLANPGVVVQVILDCCHSGTGARSLQPNVVYRYIPNQLDQIKHKKFDVVKDSKVIVWSGSRDDQTSADAYIDGQFRGAFSAAFVKTSGTRKTRYDNIVISLRNQGFTQVPQLTCGLAELDQDIF